MLYTKPPLYLYIYYLKEPLGGESAITTNLTGGTTVQSLHQRPIPAR